MPTKSEKEEKDIEKELMKIEERKAKNELAKQKDEELKKFKESAKDNEILDENHLGVYDKRLYRFFMVLSIIFIIILGIIGAGIGLGGWSVFKGKFASVINITNECNPSMDCPICPGLTCPNLNCPSIPDCPNTYVNCGNSS